MLIDSKLTELGSPRFILPLVSLPPSTNIQMQGMPGSWHAITICGGGAPWWLSGWVSDFLFWPPVVISGSWD